MPSPRRIDIPSGPRYGAAVSIRAMSPRSAGRPSRLKIAANPLTVPPDGAGSAHVRHLDRQSRQDRTARVAEPGREVEHRSEGEAAGQQEGDRGGWQCGSVTT